MEMAMAAAGVAPVAVTQALRFMGFECDESY